MPNRGPQEYLELAQHAEKTAETAASDIAKESWRAIAREYRALAEQKLKALQSTNEPKNLLRLMLRNRFE